ERTWTEIVKKEYEIKENYQALLGSINTPNVVHQIGESILSYPRIAIGAGFFVGKMVKGLFRKVRERKKLDQS
ncbi:MAG: hypothetical protein DRI73_01220, partial [Bacteroidetes bacterium]